MGLKPKEIDFENKSVEEIEDLLIEKIKEKYEFKMSHENPDHSDELERFIILQAIDQLWREHLYAMDGLREAIGWRAQGQKDPLVEYKKEGYTFFVTLMDDIKNEVFGNLFLYRTVKVPQVAEDSRTKAERADLFGGEERQAAAGGGGGVSMSGGGQEQSDGPEIRLPVRRELPKVGRNEPCPCGSGKKFKQCCGRSA